MRTFLWLMALRLLMFAVVVVGLGLFAGLFLLLAVLSKAEAQTAQPCVMPQDEIGIYYREDAAAAYGYGQPAADAIVAVLTHAAGSAPPGNPAVRVFAGLNINNGSSDFFLFDANGCFTAHLGPIPFSRMVAILTAAGAEVPEFPTPTPPPPKGGIGI